MNIPAEPKKKSRPFPWFCPSCGNHTVQPVQREYTIDVNHDGVLYPVYLPRFIVPQCQTCGETLFTIDTGDQIDAALRAKLHMLTPEQLKMGRESLGLSIRELAERVGMDEETLRLWEESMLIQTRALDNLLRLHLGLPAERELLNGRGLTNAEPSLSS